jgi:hypothetical protein
MLADGLTEELTLGETECDGLTLGEPITAVPPPKLSSLSSVADEPPAPI